MPSTGTGRLEVVDAATELVTGSVPEGTAADVDAAVAAARAASPSGARAAARPRGHAGLT